MDGWTEGWTEGRTDGQRDGRMDRGMDGWTEGWTDGQRDGRMDRGMDGWTEGWTVTELISLLILVKKQSNRLCKVYYVQLANISIVPADLITVSGIDI